MLPCPGMHEDLLDLACFSNTPGLVMQYSSSHPAVATAKDCVSNFRPYVRLMNIPTVLTIGKVLLYTSTRKLEVVWVRQRPRLWRLGDLSGQHRDAGTPPQNAHSSSQNSQKAARWSDTAFDLQYLSEQPRRVKKEERPFISTRDPSRLEHSLGGYRLSLHNLLSHV